MSESTKTLGEQILSYLAAKGRKARKAGTASVAEVAEAIGAPAKAVADRCWWMEHKDGVLVSSGEGRTRVYRTKPTKRAGVKKASKAPSTAPEAGAAEETAAGSENA